MTRVGLASAVALVISGYGIQGHLFAAYTQGSQDGAGYDAVDAYVSSEMRAERIPGVALAIVRGNEIVHMRGFGTDGAGAEITPQTSFVIGSMSKSITAFALMQLVDAGSVELDAPVQQYLPWFRVADADASRRITIRHLLNHTSGLPTAAPRARGPAPVLREQVEALSLVQLVYPPGEHHEYSSPNYLVLGAVIEEVTGTSFAAQVQDQIFTPLKMRHTFTTQSEAMEEGMSRGHRYWFGIPKQVVLPHESGRLPTAAIISSAEDLGRFMIAQLNGGRGEQSSLLSPESVSEMHRPAATGSAYSYAMGWRVSNTPDATSIHHGGIVPNFRGKMVMLPDLRTGVVVLTNASSVLPVSPGSHRMADNIAAHLSGRPLPGANPNLKIGYFVISLLVFIVTLKQLAGVVSTFRNLRHTPSRRRNAALHGLSKLLWPVVLLILLRGMIGIPLSEGLRSAPDLTYWVIFLAASDAAIGILTLISLMRATSPATRPVPA